MPDGKRMDRFAAVLAVLNIATAIQKLCEAIKAS